MARLQTPPTPYQTTTPKGFLTQRWGKWFYNLFQKLGGTRYVGTFCMSVFMDISANNAGAMYAPIIGNAELRAAWAILNETGQDPSILITDESELITVRNNAGASMGILTFPVGSGVGTIKQLELSSSNVFSENENVSVARSYTSTTDVSFTVFFIFAYL